MLKLGVQASSADKLYYSIERAKRLGCNTMQIFARNPRTFRKGAMDKEEISVFARTLKDSGISPLAVHSPYTLNIAIAKKFLYWITVKEFILDMFEADKLGADYFITHTGCYKGTSEEQGLKRVVKALRRILKKTTEVNTSILMENTSGSGTWLGYDFAQHRYILNELDFDPRLGICLDTAHAWCAGFPINTKQGVDQLVEEIDRQVGIDRLKLIHLNDTQDELGSKKDRHVDIGKGYIGEQGFSFLINHPALREIPFILETPCSSDEDDIRNMNIIRRLYRDEVYQGD